jgi:cellulose synthase/poly-beta-1,6-N-acetylglucosamine synthase-like glycosyltransferase
VVDDGGCLDANRVESMFGADLNLRILVQEWSGPAIARNYGARNARGEYLAFTDDDCEPSPAWLSALEQCFHLNPDALVGGRVLNALTENRCAAASQILSDFLCAFYTNKGVPRFFTSNNLALRREGFQQLGAFDESFPLPAAEDRELCTRWVLSGGLMVHSFDAVVYHAHPLTMAGFVRQHFRYGRGAWRFRRTCVRKDHGQVRLEPLGFYFDLFLYPLRHGRGGRIARLGASALFLLSQVANAAGFLVQALMSSGKC